MSDKIVCVNLDGVLAKYEKWEGIQNFGQVIPGARFFLEALRRVGFKIIIHTVRCSLDANPAPVCREPESWVDHLVTLVRQWLNANDLPFDEIWSDRGKPLADIYIDDRAVVCRPQDDPEAFKDAVLRAQGVAHKLKIDQ